MASPTKVVADKDIDRDDADPKSSDPTSSDPTRVADVEVTSRDPTSTTTIDGTDGSSLTIDELQAAADEAQLNLDYESKYNVWWWVSVIIVLILIAFVIWWAIRFHKLYTTQTSPRGPC
jgi:hypothetical protein